MGAIAQPVLKPSIGLYALPNDNDLICPIPLAIDPGNIFEAPGLHEGDTIPDFTLYTVNNDSLQMGELLTDGKPVLLVGGNYTCPKYRNHLDELNDLQATYGNLIHIFIIYTVEAHPQDPDISPYKGEVWELNSNIQAGIIYPQAVSYFDRKSTAMDMLAALDIDVPVLLDGPCNKWWETFALAPNPSFLINPNGTIYKKQGWFDNGLYAVSFAIDSLLGQIATDVEAIAEAPLVINDPAAPFVQFNFADQQVNARVIVLDAMGRTVNAPFNFSGNQFTMQKAGLSAGIYFYSVYEDGKWMNGKFLVQ